MYVMLCKATVHIAEILDLIKKNTFNLFAIASNGPAITINIYHYILSGALRCPLTPTFFNLSIKTF